MVARPTPRACHGAAAMLFAAALGLPGPFARAASDDIFWSRRFVAPGVSGSVFALAQYSGSLFAAGAFPSADTLPVSNVARWDGTAWRALGSGITGSTVNALAVYAGRLVAGGTFTSAGGVPATNIAAWDSSGWSTLGPGLQLTVTSLAVHQGKLIAAGWQRSGPFVVGEVMAWDGLGWSRVGSSLPYPVGALALYRDTLVVATSTSLSISPFDTSRIARLVDTTWVAITADFQGHVNSLAAADSLLFVGGYFGSIGAVTASNVARWNGTAWSALGSGTDSCVLSLLPNGGELLAGGSFIVAGSVSANAIARWNGVSWSSLGTGMRPFRLRAEVHAIAINGSDLFAGGSFTDAGGGTALGIARWNGAAWSAVGQLTPGDGPNGEVSALAVYGGKLVAGGWMARFGNLVTGHISAWDEVSWSSLGPGLDASVEALTVHQGDLIAGGRFTGAGATRVSYVARWNGSSWAPLGDGFNNAVSALAVYRGELIAGGAFTATGPPSSTPLAHIARWDGVQWRPLGSGVDNVVYALAARDTSLFVGGAFLTASPDTVRHIARWDGSAWSGLGSGTDDNVQALMTDAGGLLVGGMFREAGGVPAHSIARWNGAQWGTVGDLSFLVTALAVHDSTLVACGTPGYWSDVTPFLSALARWDGSSWSDLGSGLGGTVWAAAEYVGNLYLGGNILTAGGMPSVNLARWSGPLRTQPAPGTAATDFALDTGRPNPFWTRTTISFSLPASTVATIAIYDVRGRRVRTLIEGTLAAGRHSIVWDRHDAEGRKVPVGIYFVRMAAPGFDRARKLAVI